MRPGVEPIAAEPLPNDRRITPIEVCHHATLVEPFAYKSGDWAELLLILSIDQDPHICPFVSVAGLDSGNNPKECFEEAGSTESPINDDQQANRYQISQAGYAYMKGIQSIHCDHQGRDDSKAGCNYPKRIPNLRVFQLRP